MNQPAYAETCTCSSKQLVTRQSDETTDYTQTPPAHRLVSQTGRQPWCQPALPRLPPPHSAGQGAAQLRAEVGARGAAAVPAAGSAARARKSWLLPSPGCSVCVACPGRPIPYPHAHKTPPNTLRAHPSIRPVGPSPTHPSVRWWDCSQRLAGLQQSAQQRQGMRAALSCLPAAF